MEDLKGHLTSSLFGSKKSEVRSLKSEVRSRKLEVRSRKLEVMKLEVNSHEVRSKKS